jgi:hypothetical protein
MIVTKFKTQIFKSPLNQKMNIWFFFKYVIYMII